MQNLKLNLFSLFILLFSLNSLILCLEQSSILLLPFKGKSLQKEEDPDADDYVVPWGEEEDYPVVPKKDVYNVSTFITEWFYNGMYHVTNIGSKSIQSYINIQNSKFSIEKCNVNRVYAKYVLNDKTFYKPLGSSTYSKIEKNLGNDIFSFNGDLSYKTTIKVGEEKGKGLDFHFNEDDNDSTLCANLGLNLNIDSDTTNFIYQLKKKNYINKYVWTLRYLTEEDGIIVVGTEPHIYNNESFHMSQFCKIKAIPNQSPETAWSFKMDEVRTYDSNKNKVNLSQNKVDFLIDRGLIIGTDEYKKKIDELVFNDLISKKICYCETKTFHDEEKNTNDEYYIYYCNKNEFMGNKYTIDKTYYNSFPNLEFYVKEYNMTFSLNKDHLFHELYERSYFLVVFKKSNTENNIWKLGEPFFSHFQFTFDQDQKIVGFYNPHFEKISNDEYKKNNEYNDSKTNLWPLYIILIILGVALLIGLAYFLGKKLNENRKKRANELNDDDFDYSAEKKLNSNSNAPNTESLGI